MLQKVLTAKRSVKRLISILYDGTFITLALYLSISIRLGEPWLNLDLNTYLCFAVTLVITLIAFVRLGLYRAILRYSPAEALMTVLLGVIISSTVYIVSSFYLNTFVPRSSPIIYFFVATLLLGAPRLLMRSIVQLSNNGLTTKVHRANRKNLIVYGAGYSGHQFAQSMEGSKQYKVRAYIDDNKKLVGNKLNGITIYSPNELKALAGRFESNTLILAMGAITRAQKINVFDRAAQMGLDTLTVPPINDILSGKAQIQDIKPIAIEDLLGRDPVAAKPELLDACIKGKSVMVTGAGGSIGSELCRQIIAHKPSQLILFELNEYSLYTIEQELKAVLDSTNSATVLTALIGSVQKEHRLETIMTTFGVNTVYHAAAYKHVPLVEHNIIEGVRNNVFGSLYCAEAAIKAKVESFVLVSTDKAVRPTNFMGTSKRIAELVLQGLAQRQHETRFTMVRFGNVLGSSGSVVPLFRKQIEAGGPLTVTHPDIIRYFMTIPEAAELVIQAGSMGEGGDVFVLDMGDPIKIVDLAKRMIQLSGLDLKDSENSSGDIEIQYPGLRPGEKLYEELLIGDNVSSTDHPRIMRAQERSLSWSDTEKLLESLDVACHDYHCDEVKTLLMEAPTDFTPDSDIQDSVWTNKQRV